MGLPTMILLTLRARAYLRISSPIRCPLKVTVSAPSCSASRSVSVRRIRSGSGNLMCAGVSTYATIHSARSPVAIRFAARTIAAECGLGLTQTMRRSVTGQVFGMAWSRM